MAYRLTSRPADGMEIDISCATVGSRPTITNSVVPMAKAAIVSAHNAPGSPFRCFADTALVAMTDSGILVMVFMMNFDLTFYKGKIPSTQTIILII